MLLVPELCPPVCLHTFGLNSLQMVWGIMMNQMGSQASVVTQKRRLVLGVVILLLVDVIWVASSELTAVSRQVLQIRFL